MLVQKDETEFGLFILDLQWEQGILKLLNWIGFQYCVEKLERKFRIPCIEFCF